MTTIRVIIYDDEPSQAAQLENVFRDVLRRISVDATFDLVHERSALERRLRTHPHLVLCDLFFGRSNPAEGCAAISALKCEYPHITFVLLTSADIDISMFASHWPNPDLLLSKTQLVAEPSIELEKTPSVSIEADEASEPYRSRVACKLSSLMKRGVVDEIVCVDDDGQVVPGGLQPILKAFPKSKPRELELVALIEQVVGAGPLYRLRRVRRATLRPIRNGFSGAAVFELRLYFEWPDTGMSEFGGSAVLKVSKSANALREQTAFDSVVKWYLPYLWRIDILGRGMTKGYGATCYSFALEGEEERAEDLIFHLRRGQSEFVDRVVETIFNSEKKAWYEITTKSELGIGQHYYREMFGGGREAPEADNHFVERLEQICQRDGKFTKKTANTLTLGTTTFPRPFRFLFGQSGEPFLKCLCHGDLHAGNIMSAGKTRNLAFIDFKRSGMGHCFIDFITFESSIRMDFGVDVPSVDDRTMTFEERIELELSLFGTGFVPTGTPKCGYLHQIEKIRAAAHKNFRNEPFGQYVFGLVCYSVWLLTFDEDAGDRKWGDLIRERCLAVIIAGLRWLASEESSQSPSRSTTGESA